MLFLNGPKKVLVVKYLPLYRDDQILWTDRGIPWGPRGPKIIYMDLGHLPEYDSQVEALSSSASANEPEEQDIWVKLELIQNVQNSENK